MQNEKLKGNYKYFLITKNYDCEQVARKNWKADLEAIPSVTYWKGQLEVGEKGTYHAQALLYFLTSKRTSHFKEMGMWVSGISAADASLRVQKYVTKDQTRVEGPAECGICPSGLRKGRDWEEARKLAKEGRFEEIQASIYVPYLNNLKKIHFEATTPKQTEDCRGVWIVGKAGMGKSHYARSMYSASLYIKQQNKWWDGYNGETTVLLDDLDSPCMGHLLKIWGDKWSFRGESKGGTINPQYENFVVTSNYYPSDLWGSDQILCEAISRRFIFIVFYEYQKYVIGKDRGEIPLIPSFFSDLIIIK